MQGLFSVCELCLKLRGKKMIRKINIGWLVRCDDCSKCYESAKQELPIEVIRSRMKKVGWGFKRFIDVWALFCPECNKVRAKQFAISNKQKRRKLHKKKNRRRLVHQRSSIY